MRTIVYVILVGIFFGNHSHAQSSLNDDLNKQLEQLSTHPEWLAQLQYRKTLFSSWQSEADGADFFISPKGKSSPFEELKATLELFEQNPDKPWGFIKQPVICAFPTRRRFLEQQLQKQFKSVACVERDQWQQPFIDTDFYLIYSSAYPNNPASMFGHTFTLFTKSKTPDSAKGLLDYAINFSANTAGVSERSIFYTILGIFGGYPGQYQMYPFYQMVNLYSNWEARDLWYLKVPWRSDQVGRFLDHIWEIFTNTYFDYYFFDENCSYRLLAAMDYAEPKLKLIDTFYRRAPLYYVAPLDTFKAVKKFYGEQTSEYYTPSIRKSLLSLYNHLGPQEQKRFRTLSRDLSKLSEEHDISVLDTLVTYFDYRLRTSSKTYLPENRMRDLTQVLQRRAQITTPSPPTPAVERPSSPLVSHPAHAARLGVMWRDPTRSKNLANSQRDLIEDQLGVNLYVKVAYHDALSPGAGFERWSHMNFGELEATQYSDRLEFERLTVVDIISFSPINATDSRFSWAINVGYNERLKMYGRPGAGWSAELIKNHLLSYFFVFPVLSTNRDLTDELPLASELEFGHLVEWSKSFKSWFIFRSLLHDPNWNFSDDVRTGVIRTSWHFNSLQELRLNYEVGNQRDRWLLGFQQNF